MTIKQRLLGLALTLILVVAVAVEASSTLAQNDDDIPPTPYSTGTMGLGWNMDGMMWSNWQNETMWTSIASAIGIDVNILLAELQSGSTLTQIAEAHGVDVQNVYDAVLVVMTEHMNSMVEAGYITQEQADVQLNWMRDNVAQMPMLSTTGFGPCSMGRMMGNYGWNGMHGGMMGFGSQSNQTWQNHRGHMGARHGWNN